MTRANQIVAGDAKQNLNLGANLLPKLLRDRDRDASHGHGHVVICNKFFMNWLYVGRVTQ